MHQTRLGLLLSCYRQAGSVQARRTKSKPGKQVKSSEFEDETCERLMGRPLIHHDPEVVELLDDGFDVAAKRGPIGLVRIG